jgi:mannose-6-phosphate isomerase-like protein (cupin superfamily)
VLNTDEDIPYIDKPWGYERIWAQTDKYIAKYVFIGAGHKMSRQYHEKKDKTIYILSGPLTLELGPDHEDDEILSLGLTEGESYRVTSGSVHRFCASAGYSAELIEVSTPELTDVIRLEDDYNRTPDISA